MEDWSGEDNSSNVSAEEKDLEVQKILKSRKMIKKNKDYSSLIENEIFKVLDFAKRNNDIQLIYWCFNTPSCWSGLRSDILVNIIDFARSNDNFSLLKWCWHNSNEVIKKSIWQSIFDNVKETSDTDDIKWCFEAAREDSEERKLIWTFLTTLDKPIKPNYIELLKWVYENNYFSVKNAYIWDTVVLYAKKHKDAISIEWCKAAHPAFFFLKFGLSRT